MIDRSYRFHGRKSLRAVYTHGQAIRGPLVAVKFSSNPRRSHYRLAVVVSKKVNASAVVRNRIRRRVYETIRQAALVEGPYDVVVTVYSDQLSTMPTDALTQLLSSQFHQA
ncbi:ribonuclease P protein component, partial [Candidatus Saccharibacteria bacterium]|nr:ribonuclease P protein component [Candidatus Saccharibacteria bacterium]